MGVRLVERTGAAAGRGIARRMRLGPARQGLGSPLRLVFVTLTLGGCVSDRPDLAGPPEQAGDCRLPPDPSTPDSLRALVAMRNFAFQPGELHVRAGTTVTWVNCERADLDPHTATSDVGAWSSGFLQPGASFTRRFDEPGRFDYHCIPHPFMRAAVVVE